MRQKFEEKRASQTITGQVHEGMLGDNDSKNTIIVNFTKVPNIFMDEWLGNMSKVETKCFLYICRKTYGYHKTEDAIALAQFVKNGCALNQKSVRKALMNLEFCRVIKITNIIGCPNVYSVLTPTKKGIVPNQPPQKKVYAHPGLDGIDTIIGRQVTIDGGVYYVIDALQHDGDYILLKIKNYAGEYFETTVSYSQMGVKNDFFSI